MEDPTNRSNMDWGVQRNYPRPDYLSSSRKRLAPQLIYKGGILKKWGNKQAVALHKNFFNRLPTLPEIDKTEADIAWLIYDLKHNPETNRYQLYHSRTVYTLFQAALERITIAEAGSIENFIAHLQSKLDERLDNPPDAPTLLDIL